MPWDKTRKGTPVYVIKEMVNGEVVRRYAGSGEAGAQAEQDVRRQRFQKREARHREFEIHELLNRYEKLVRAVIDESLIHYGYIKRPDRRWARISRCHKLDFNERQQTIQNQSANKAEANRKSA